MKISFEGEIWFWKGPAPWFFVTVPEQQGRDLQAIMRMVTYGWGMIPVEVEIGQSRWKTALFPKDDRYIVPIRANIRKAENLHEGDTIFVQLEVQG